MNCPSVVLALSVAASAASSFGGEREWWIPGPASLHYGAIGDGYLLSYQWEPSDMPETRRLPPMTPRKLVPAEQWLAAEKWEPKDIRWLVADLAKGRVTPLAEIMPGEAKGLTVIPMRARPHNAFHRWRLAYGGLWATSLRCDAGVGDPAWLLCMPFPLRELETSHGRDSGPGICVPEESRPHAPEELGGRADESDEGAARERVGERVARPAGFYIRSWTSFLGKAATLERDGRRRTAWGGEVRVDFDFLPVWEDSKHEVTFFVLAEDSMSVWTNRWEPVTTKGGDSRLREGQWQRQAIFASPFIEPFHLAAADGAYFFVTDESGAVYVAEETNGEWNTRSLWNDPNRPVIAMVTESDTTTAFVFGKDFYFELARQIQPRPCKDITQGRQDLTDPMRTVLECAKVLHHAGLLKHTNAMGHSGHPTDRRP